MQARPGAVIRGIYYQSGNQEKYESSGKSTRRKPRRAGHAPYRRLCASGVRVHPNYEHKLPGYRATQPKQKDIPDEPTIWVVSAVDALEYRFGKGFVFYKVTPINPGRLNMRYAWIMDVDGAFKVGDQVSFQKVKP